MPNPRANRPLTLDQVTADLKSFAQPAQALFDMMAGGLRGSAVGTFGAPGDIETLARMGVNAAGGSSFNPAMPSRSGRAFQPVSEEPYFPSSEELAKRFPPTIPNGDPVRQKSAGPFEELGQFAPLPLSGKALKVLPYALGRGTGEVTKEAARAINDAMIHQTGPLSQGPLSMLAPKGAVSHVVKPKGGNWLTGSVEQAVKPLKRRVATENIDQYTPEQAARLEASGRLEINDAINNWVDRNLTNYIKKEMATPEDPVRRLAEEGVTHLPRDVLQGAEWLPESTENVRRSQGFPGAGLAKTNIGRGWENLSEEAIAVTSPKGLKPQDKELNPWVSKLDPNQSIYRARSLDVNQLGFDHIVDVLREDVATGRIRPEQLNKVSMEQAVRRTAEYDQEMARKMAEAQIKATEGMPVHKEYPEGYKWVELAPPKMPDVLPEGWSEPVQKGNALQTVSPEGKIVLGFNLPDLVKNIYRRHPETPGNSEKALEEALKYEGDTMGHCVGGYCPDVIQGKSRIYSLRDKRGEPHVTVEVKPNEHLDYNKWFDRQTEEVQNKIAKRRLDDKNHDIYEGPEYLADRAALLPKITQIKGKGNRAPKPEYLPFVQDFVRGGKWSDVGDLHNTGLRDIQNTSLAKYLKNKGVDAQRYLPEDEYLKYEDDFLMDRLYPNDPLPTDGMKHGGSVHISDNPDTMMMELGDQHFALGGVTDVLKLVKANRARQAAQAAEKELALPPKLPRAKPRSKEELRPLAQEMAEATRGDFYRPEPSKSFNPAGKSFEQWKTEQGLVHDIRPTAKRQDIPRANIEKQKGMVKMGISGDTTAAEQVLHEAGPYALDIPSPQHGGALYGLGGEGAWASNNPIAANVQKRINEISQAYGDAPVLGQYMQMGKLGSDFALHFADANLRAIDLRGMSKDQIEMVNELIRKGSPKSGPRPSFPGIEDKDSAYLHFAVDPELRKHFNAIMQKPTYTEPLGLPDGRIIHHAITEPELRDLPVTTTGFSQMELAPGYDPEKLLLSEHPTYSHVIPNKPGTGLTRTQYHMPAQVEFPDVYEYLTETAPKKSRPQDMTRMYQTSSPRQIIDQQHIDEIKMFEELMKQYGGKKKGGAITIKPKKDGQKFKPGKKPDQILKHGQAMPRGKDPEVDIGQMIPQMSAGGKLSKVALEAIERMKAMRPEIAAKSSLEQKALTENTAKYARDIKPFSMTDEDVASEMKRLESKGLAGGGAINADDLILEERPL